MKFRVFSDIHLDFYRSNTIPKLWQPLLSDRDTTLIIAGDICTASKADLTISWLNELSLEFKHVVLVLGNHDYWGSPNWAKEPAIIRKGVNHNVYVLEKEIITLEGVTIGGATLWTDINNHDPLDMVSVNSYTKDMMFIRGMQVKDWLSEFELTKRWIEANKVDILVTHYVPSRKFCAPKYRYDSANCMFNSEVVMNMQPESLPKYWIFGHTHDSYNEEFLGTKFICNPKGYINENIHGFDGVSLYEV